MVRYLHYLHHINFTQFRGELMVPMIGVLASLQSQMLRLCYFIAQVPACDGSRMARRSCTTKVLYGKAEKRVASERKQARIGGNTKSPGRKNRMTKSVDCVGRTREKVSSAVAWFAALRLALIASYRGNRQPFAFCRLPFCANIPYTFKFT